MDQRHFQIRASRDGWDGYAVVAIGQGTTVNEALAEAAKLIGHSFRPKQDGRTAILMSVTLERPNGSRFNVHPERLANCGTAEELEEAKEN